MSTLANPFASATLVEHLARGAGAVAAFAAAFWLLSSGDGWRLVLAAPLVGGAFVAMRGCPMCWLAGLFGTVAACRAPRRG